MEIASLISKGALPPADANWRTWLAGEGYTLWRSDVLRVGDTWLTFEVYRVGDRFTLYYPPIPGTRASEALYLHGDQKEVEERLNAGKDFAAHVLRSLQECVN